MKQRSEGGESPLVQKLLTFLVDLSNAVASLEHLAKFSDMLPPHGENSPFDG